ncbi:MAG: hypothetical protein MUF35_12435 [Candidatus Nanopelagicales bacterium]|nr:hypothetical protein [Candidatus Nanopelagicales bacterium]
MLAGYLRGTVPHDRGLRDVAVALSLGDPLDEALNASLIKIPGGQVRLLPGLATAAQAPAVASLWQPLAEHLRSLDTAGLDVMIDLGRWGSRNGPDPLAHHLDLMLLVTRSDLPGIAAARGWVPVLSAELDALGHGADALRALVVGPGRPYSTREIAAALDVPVVGDVAWDPRSAASLSHGEPPQRSAAHGSLHRSLAALASTVAATASSRPSLTGEVAR